MTPNRETHVPRRVVSGGQTGVDRGALDAAIQLGINHGGWCPRGRLAEDGPIDSRYQLSETLSARYSVRTRLNVRDSDGTLILYRDSLHGGTELTWQFAQRMKKPFLLVELKDEPDIDHVRSWIRDQQIKTLNVAGPRESSSPGIGQAAQSFLERVFGAAQTDE